LKDDPVSLVIRDNGVGLPETIAIENSIAFGLRLVGILFKQIAGMIRIEHGNGTVGILEFQQ
jgi:two-component sensor histidine kinase